MSYANATPLEFFGHLNWIDGRPLLDTLEPYRREFLSQALYTFRDDGAPLYNLVLSGRAKKNNKTTDLILAGFYRLLAWNSPAGNDGFILANDEDQAGDDLELAKKLVLANPDTLGTDCVSLLKAIRRRDHAGQLRILPSRDAVGQHGKTASFIGFDEIHGLKNHDLLEALAPDPTRVDALTWITSYDTIYSTPGVPLFDLKQIGIAGTDPRMLFSWYSGNYCTDPTLEALPPEQRANPSMGSWPEGPAYLEQQRRRLPTHKYRRLHLNLPGSPNGAFLDGDFVRAVTVSTLTVLPYDRSNKYVGFVDMSGGSSDDATLGIAHKDRDGRRILDFICSQSGKPPFNPRDAVKKFAGVLKQYHVSRVIGDAYAGETFRYDFEAEKIAYKVAGIPKTELYEQLEPMVNAAEVELLDVPKLYEQLITLVVRGSRVDHQPGDHDDWANAAAGALTLAIDAYEDDEISMKPPPGYTPKFSDPLEMFR